MFLSCKDNQIGAALTSAEISMNDKPESSLEVLESIDKDLLLTRKQKAKYALLYSIALDKNYIDIKADSIIAPAVEYYECHGSVDDKIKSLYYYARVQYNSGEYNPAIVTLMKAIPLFENSTERRYCALVHNLLAIIYNVLYQYPYLSYSMQVSNNYFQISKHFVSLPLKFNRIRQWNLPVL